MPLPALLLPKTAAAITLAGSLSGGLLAGPAQVVDGDTLHLEATSVRLSGVDAPELSQMCGAQPCGLDARAALQRLTHGRIVICTVESFDRYGRAVARCFADGENLSAAMAREGQALAYRRFSDDYVQDEEAARAARKGLWGTEGFMPPWDWRRMRRAG